MEFHSLSTIRLRFFFSSIPLSICMSIQLCLKLPQNCRATSTRRDEHLSESSERERLTTVREHCFAKIALFDSFMLWFINGQILNCVWLLMVRLQIVGSNLKEVRWQLRFTHLVTRERGSLATKPTFVARQGVGVWLGKVWFRLSLNCWREICKTNHLLD